MARFRSPPPLWFRAVAIVLILWGVVGVYACWQQFRLGAEAMGPATDYDRALYASLPVWYNAVYAVSVGCGLLGALALLARSALSIPLFVISLIGVVVMFGWIFVATDLIAHKGVVVATGFPVFVAVVAAFQIWFARFGRTRGWIG